MPTSSLSIAVDRTEYSPYYPINQKVTAYITTAGSAGGATVTLSLFREDGFGVVSSKTATIIANKAVIVFDTKADGYDANLIFRAVLGTYHLAGVVSDSSVTANSPSFRIAPVSVAELKATYLQGVDLLSSNVVIPRQQPRIITGVSVVDTATTAQHDVFTLAYTNATHAFSFDGGTAVVVSQVGLNRYLLLNGDSTWWIEIEVIGELLPTADASEPLIFDYDHIDDSDIQQVLDNVYGLLQGRIQVALEPREVNTDGPGSELNAGEYVDDLKEPLTYYKVNFAKTWMYIKFPTSNILKVWRIDGYFQSSRAFSVQVDQWIVKNAKAGEVEFVPRYGAVLSFQFFGVPFFAYMHTFESIPSFWHYRLTVGLKDLDRDQDRQRVRTALLRWAAMDVLVIAGQASAPGLVGENTSRDGVSESRSYAQGEGGRYANIVQFHSRFLFGPNGDSGETTKLRDKFVGVMMVIL